MPGAYGAEGTEAFVGQFRRRMGGQSMRRLTTDSYLAYEAAILEVYGEAVTPPRTGKPGRPKGPYKAPLAGVVYAAVGKVREKGRVVEVLTRAVSGTMATVAATLVGPRVSRSINTLNTPFIERRNLTDRYHNARKSRKAYRSSKGWRSHEAATYLTMDSYNFCWPVMTPYEPLGEGRWRRRTPVMAAGLTDHAWSISEWISLPAVLQS